MEELLTALLGTGIIIFSILWLILWTITPFLIYGINSKLKDLIRILKRIERLKK